MATLEGHNHLILASPSSIHYIRSLYNLSLAVLNCSQCAQARRRTARRSLRRTDHCIIRTVIEVASIQSALWFVVLRDLLRQNAFGISFPAEENQRGADWAGGALMLGPPAASNEASINGNGGSWGKRGRAGVRGQAGGKLQGKLWRRWLAGDRAARRDWEGNGAG